MCCLGWLGKSPILLSQMLQKHSVIACNLVLCMRHSCDGSSTVLLARNGKLRQQQPARKSVSFLSAPMRQRSSCRHTVRWSNRRTQSRMLHMEFLTSKACCLASVTPNTTQLQSASSNQLQSPHRTEHPALSRNQHNITVEAVAITVTALEKGCTGSCCFVPAQGHETGQE